MALEHVLRRCRHGCQADGQDEPVLKLRHALRRKYAFAFVDLQSIEGADVRECFSFIAAEMRAQLPGSTARDLSLPSNGSEFLAFARGSLERRPPFEPS